MAVKKMSFEQATQRLDEILRALEGGNESLDASLKLYEEGVALLRSCTALLDGAEQKVKMLQFQPDGGVALADFAGEEESK